MQEKFNTGDHVTWETVNGPRTGIIEDKHTLGYLVRLDRGKCVIVHPNSLREGGVIVPR